MIFCGGIIHVVVHTIIFFSRCFFFEFIFRLFMCSTNLWFCYEPRTYIFLCSWNRLKCGVNDRCLFELFKQFICSIFHFYMWVKRKRSLLHSKIINRNVCVWWNKISSQQKISQLNDTPARLRTFLFKKKKSIKYWSYS